MDFLVVVVDRRCSELVSRHDVKDGVVVCVVVETVGFVVCIVVARWRVGLSLFLLLLYCWYQVVAV